jgi:hypothetical protein
MTKPNTRRIERGAGHSYLLDGEPCPGVTSILRDGLAKPALINWAANATAGYAVDRWAELSELGPSERLRRLERARYESSNEARARGTDIHALAVELAAGREVDVSDALTGYVDAYLAFVEAWRVTEQLVEATVISRRWRYAGTLDLLAQLGDGRTWLLDYKTGASGVWPETALQLAAYANADAYLDADGAEHPMPKVDACAAVWLRDDGYSLIPLAVTAETFRTFLYVQQVASFATLPRDAHVLEALQPPRWLEVAQ